MAFQREEAVESLTLPVSCLVYLFGDLFVKRRWLPWDREHLSWRRPRFVGQEDLARAILVTTFVSLTERSHLILRPGERRDEGFILGTVLGTDRKTVWATRRPESGEVDGLLENELLQRIEGRTSIYLLLKELMEFGLNPWDKTLAIVRRDLGTRGYLRGHEVRVLGGLAKEWRFFPDNVEKIQTLEGEALAIRDMIDGFKETRGDLYHRLYEEIAFSFRTERDRLLR